MADSENVDEAPRLLPQILDHRAESEPDRVWAKFPVSPISYDKGFRAATYGQIRNAVNRMAWMLEETIGTSTQFDTLAYLGPGDVRYHIIFLAAIKTGYKAFFPSPRNSLPAQKDLLSRLECRILVTTDPEPPFVAGVLREYPIRSLHIPSLDELLQSQAIPSYPYVKSFEAVRNDTALVLHSSGSTGIPKPMIYTHEFIWRTHKASVVPAPEGMIHNGELFLQGEFFSFLPAFHIAGIGWGLWLPMFSNSVPVLPLPGRPPSTDAFIEAVNVGHFEWAFLLPVIIDELSKDPEALDLVVSKLKYLLYTGGALPSGAGDSISSRIPVFSALGSSECSAFPLLRISDSSFTETWRYFNFHPGAGTEFRNHMDDLHELVIVKSTDHLESQPVFSMFPHLDEYETKDLFSPHSQIPGMWRHRGRRDDIVVFVNGEKTNPISFEEQISRHPGVRAALVAGNQRFEACLLVEPIMTDPLSDLAKRELIENIWPAVEEANQLCPAHARISKSKILVLDPEKSMLRAGKGTVQRNGTLQLYAEQIDALYLETDAQSTLKEQHPISTLNPNNAVGYLHELVAKTTSWSQFQDDADFFTLGLDSLQTLQLSASIRAKFGISSITPSVIYKNPSVELLVRQIYPESAAAASEENDPVATMTRMLQQYEQLIDNLAFTETTNPSKKNVNASQVILLTGSTGSVGSFVLNELLSCSEVSHIYCLNRGQDSGPLQETRNRQRGINCELPSDQVTFLTVDLSKESFGLDPKEYSVLVERTTQIIHNAWPVDFNQPVQFFKSSLDGLLGLVSFAHQAQLAPSLLFLSSISAVGSYNRVPNAGSLVPEETIPDLICASPMGYGQSKYLAEKILGHASEKLSIRGGVARIGQVSGTRQNPRGWNRSEWLPSLILSSRYLRALPDSLAGSLLDLIDWVPLDDLASIIVELSSGLAGSCVTGTAHVYNCVNPQNIAWSDLVPAIVQELEQPLVPNGEKLQIVTVGFRAWLDKLRASEVALLQGESLDVDLQQNPAVKLLDFYEQLIIESRDNTPIRLSTEKSVQASEHLRDLKPIEPEWVRGWIQEWTNGK